MRSPVIAAATLLAGCGGGASPIQPAATPTAPNVVQARVAAMGAGERNAVLLRAIRDAGKDCQGVTGSARKGDADGQPLYVATCQDGASYGIVIAADGTAQVAGAR